MKQNSFLEAVYIRERFSGYLSHAHPHQNGAGNMVSMASGLSALAFFNARHLLEFSVKLLNLPANGTRLLRPNAIKLVFWLQEKLGNLPLFPAFQFVQPDARKSAPVNSNIERL